MFLKYLAPVFCLGKRARMLMVSKDPARRQPDEHNEVINVEPENSKPAVPSLYPKSQQLEEGERVRMLQEEVHRLTAHVQGRHTAAVAPQGATPAQQQWRLITLVLDRFFAVFFFLVNIVTLILLLPWPGADWK